MARPPGGAGLSGECGPASGTGFLVKQGFLDLRQSLVKLDFLSPPHVVNVGLLGKLGFLEMLSFLMELGLLVELGFLVKNLDLLLELESRAGVQVLLLRNLHSYKRMDSVLCSVNSSIL